MLAAYVLFKGEHDCSAVTGGERRTYLSSPSNLVTNAPRRRLDPFLDSSPLCVHSCFGYLHFILG